jgi:hypothetical protein
MASAPTSEESDINWNVIRAYRNAAKTVEKASHQALCLNGAKKLRSKQFLDGAASKADVRGWQPLGWL